MRKSAVLFALMAFQFGAADGYSQGTFQNLGFESANVSGYPPGSVNVPTSLALPGWTAYGFFSGTTNIAAQVLYDNASLGAAAISLIDSNNMGFSPLQGMYSVLLQGSSAGTPGGVSIGQAGQIPVGTESLRFFGEQLVNIQVSFGGQNISYAAIGTGPNYTIYGANISEYAGQTGQLLFTALPSTDPLGGSGLIDNIQFSVNPVPEPGTWALLLCGAAAFRFAWRKAPQPRQGRR